MVCNLDDGEEDPDNDSVDDPDIPNCAGKVQVEGEREAEQEQPDIEVECVGKYPVVRVIVPATRQGGPDPLADYVQHLGPHHVHLDKKR